MANNYGLMANGGKVQEPKALVGLEERRQEAAKQKTLELLKAMLCQPIKFSEGQIIKEYRNGT